MTIASLVSSVAECDLVVLVRCLFVWKGCIRARKGGGGEVAGGCLCLNIHQCQFDVSSIAENTDIYLSSL